MYTVYVTNKLPLPCASLQSTASPLLNLQIVLFLQKELKSFLFGFSFWSWQRVYWLCWALYQ